MCQFACKHLSTGTVERQFIRSGKVMRKSLTSNISLSQTRPRDFVETIRTLLQKPELMVRCITCLLRCPLKFCCVARLMKKIKKRPNQIDSIASFLYFIYSFPPVKFSFSQENFKDELM